MWDEHNTRKPILSLRLSGCCCCGRPSARCLHYCSKTHRAARGPRLREPHRTALCRTKYGLVWRGNAKKRERRCAALSVNSKPAVQRSAAPGVSYSMEDEHNTRKPILSIRSSGVRCCGRPSARSRQRRTKTHRAAPGPQNPVRPRIAVHSRQTGRSTPSRSIPRRFQTCRTDPSRSLRKLPTGARLVAIPLAAAVPAVGLVLSRLRCPTDRPSSVPARAAYSHSASVGRRQFWWCAHPATSCRPSPRAK